MKIARVRHGDATFLARVHNGIVTLIAKESTRPTADALRDSFAAGVDLSGGGEEFVLDDVQILAPVANPSKVLGIGLNYRDHAREIGAELPASPIVFAKSPSSVVGPGVPIAWAATASDQVDYEAELAVIIGREAAGELADPLSHIFGYTCCNDVSARDAQAADGQWVRGKSFDSFCPLGPWIVTADEVPDPQRLELGCDVNGRRLQSGSTSEMVFGVAEIVAYLARFMRLFPGDVITTGTPAGVGLSQSPPRFLRFGDTVTTWVTGIGELSNACIAK